MKCSTKGCKMPASKHERKYSKENEKKFVCIFCHLTFNYGEHMIAGVFFLTVFSISIFLESVSSLSLISYMFYTMISGILAVIVFGFVILIPLNYILTKTKVFEGIANSFKMESYQSRLSSFKK